MLSARIRAYFVFILQESANCQLEMSDFDFCGLAQNIFSYSESTLPSVELCLFKPTENIAIYLSKYINTNHASQDQPLHLCMFS